MKKALLICAVVLLAVYIGAGYYISGLILGGPDRDYTASQEFDNLALAGLADMPTPQAVTLDNNGTMIAGSFYKNPNDANCAIILLHGRGGNRAETMKYVPLFWQHNCDVLAYDQRGFGNSSDTFRTFGYYGRKDASIAVNWLSKTSELPPSRIGILGTSYGASVALQTLAERSDLAFVIADSPFSNMSEIVSEHSQRMFGQWASMFLPGAFLIAELRTGITTSVVSPKDIVATSQTPVLLIHSTEDHVNEPVNAQRIFEKSNPKTTTLHLLDWGKGHTNAIQLDPEAYREMVHGFIEDMAPQYLEKTVMVE